MRYILISAFVLINAALLTGKNVEFITLGAAYYNFPDGFYPEKWSISFAYCNVETDDNGKVNEFFKTFYLAAIYKKSGGNKETWSLSGSLFEYHNYFDYTRLEVYLLKNDASGFAKNFGSWARLGLGYVSGDGSENFLTFSLTPYIGVGYFVPEKEFYKNFKIFSNTEINGTEFALQNEIGIATGFLNIKAVNEIQALPGDEAAFFYKLRGLAEINFGDINDFSAPRYSLVFGYYHERAFIENYKQLNDSFNAGIVVYW